MDNNGALWHRRRGKFLRLNLAPVVFKALCVVGNIESTISSRSFQFLLVACNLGIWIFKLIPLHCSGLDQQLNPQLVILAKCPERSQQFEGFSIYSDQLQTEMKTDINSDNHLSLSCTVTQELSCPAPV